MSILRRNKIEMQINFVDVIRGKKKDQFLEDGDEVRVPRKEPWLIAPATAK
jgi:hypothetical protein